METEIKQDGVYINNTLIDEKIFQEEKVNYSLIGREDQIDNLINWISEASGSDRANDLYLMREDLKYLMNLEDEYIFSSILTNEFIVKSNDEEGFNKICNEILELNKKLKIKYLK